MIELTAQHERPVFFDAGSEHLFGIITVPETHDRRIGVVMLSGGSSAETPGRNRIWVRLARRLAADGFTSIRFDYHGMGESTGRIGRVRLDEPFTEDATAAAALLREQGVEHIVLLGTCFGSRVAFAAGEAIDDLIGIATFPLPTRDMAMGERLTSLPLSWYVRRAVSGRVARGMLDTERRAAYVRAGTRKLRAIRRRASRRNGPSTGRTLAFSWLSPSLRRQAEQLVARHVAVLLMYGDDDDFFHDFTRGNLEDAVTEAGGRLEVDVVEGKLHGLATRAMQDHVVERVHAWLRDIGTSVATTR